MSNNSEKPSRVHILNLTPTPSSSFIELAFFDTVDGVYNDSLLITAVADGSLKIYDLSLPPTSNPIRSLHKRSRKVQSVDYNPIRRYSFISSLWDDSTTNAHFHSPVREEKREGELERERESEIAFWRESLRESKEFDKEFGVLNVKKVQANEVRIMLSCLIVDFMFLMSGKEQWVTKIFW